MKQKLNILLTVPRYETYGGNLRYVMPVGILCISSYLKCSQAANVHTLNLNHRKGKEEDILSDEIAKHDIDVFGVGGLSGEYTDIARMVRYARKIKPSIIIIVGGGIMTAEPEVAMQALPEVDYGIIGEGELTVVELMNVLTRHQPVYQVDGLIFPEAGKYTVTPPRKEVMNLDSLPFPDYEGFDYGEYLEENPDTSDTEKNYSQVSVIGGRSCKYNCTFCFHPSGTTYRQRSLNSIFEEIDYLVSHYNISYIALREELFATDNKRVREFCERADQYSFCWSIQLRIDSINASLVEMLKNSRCRYVFIGIESVHDDILRSMRKHVTQRQIEDALSMLAEANINSRSGIIFGDRMETVETALWTYHWYMKNKNRYRMFLDMIIAFPGTELYRDACRKGLIADPVQFLKDSCPVINISKMSGSEFRFLVDLVENESRRQYKLYDYCNYSTAEIVLTNQCNYNCRHCYLSVSTARQKEFSTEECINIVDQLVDAGIFQVELTGGECLLRKDFFEIVDHITANNMIITSILSNGAPVTEEILQKFQKRNIKPAFQISFDGTSGHHNWLRNSPNAEEKTVESIRLLKKYGHNVYIIMTIHHGNKDSLRETVLLMKELNIDSLYAGYVTTMGKWVGEAKTYSMKSAEYYDTFLDYLPYYKSDGMPVNIQLGCMFRYVKETGKFSVPMLSNTSDRKYVCKMSAEKLYISSDGTVMPCSLFTNSDGSKTLPNIFSTALKDILKSPDFLKYSRCTYNRLKNEGSNCFDCEFLPECGGKCHAGEWRNEPQFLIEKDLSCTFFKKGYDKKIHQVWNAEI